jgi:DNA adenine methylase
LESNRTATRRQGVAQVASRVPADSRLEPFLKWPGGKRALLPELLKFVPSDFGTYFEPFLGAGALFFAIRPVKAVLSDKNSDVVTCFKQVRDNPSGLISNLRRLTNSSEEYYRVRSSSPRMPGTKAARLIYLARLSFNGIYRVNLDGNFNVPYGKRTHRCVCDAKNLRDASGVLKGKRILCADFESVVKEAKKRDFIYIDPPYTVAHTNNGFLKYNDKIFSWSDQVRLASVADSLARKGCYVLISNAWHPSIRQLYKNFVPHEISRPSSIAAAATSRKTILEYLFTNAG